MRADLFLCHLRPGCSKVVATYRYFRFILTPDLTRRGREIGHPVRLPGRQDVRDRKPPLAESLAQTFGGLAKTVFCENPKEEPRSQIVSQPAIPQKWNSLGLGAVRRHRRTVVPAGAVACGRRQAGPSAAVSPPTCCRSFGKCRAPAKRASMRLLDICPRRTCPCE